MSVPTRQVKLSTHHKFIENWTPPPHPKPEAMFLCLCTSWSEDLLRVNPCRRSIMCLCVI